MIICNSKRSFLLQIIISIGGILLIILTYLISKSPNNVGGMGGSFVLYFLVIAAIIAGYFHKSLAMQYAMTALIIVGIMFANFLASLEMKTGFLNLKLRLVFVGCIIWILYWFLRSIFSLIKSADELGESDKRFRNYLAIVLGSSMFISIPFIAITHTTFSMLKIYDPNAVSNVGKNPFINYSNISLSLLILAFFISMSYLMRLDDKRIRNILVEDKIGLIKYPHKIKILFSSAILVIVGFGSILETQRGMWVMWIETILVLVLMALIFWKVYKHVFIQNQFVEN